MYECINMAPRAFSSSSVSFRVPPLAAYPAPPPGRWTHQLARPGPAPRSGPVIPAARRRFARRDAQPLSRRRGPGPGRPAHAEECRSRPLFLRAAADAQGRSRRTRATVGPPRRMTLTVIERLVASIRQNALSLRICIDCREYD